MARNSTTDRAKLARLAEFRDRKVKELLEAVSWAMSDPKGRLLLYDFIFTKCGLMDIYEAQDSGIYRNEGRRKVGGDYVRQLQRDHPEKYLLMIHEQLMDQQSELAHEAAVQEDEGDRDA